MHGDSRGAAACAEGKCLETYALGKAAMTQTAKAQEPSMEEILASIRRIIADDDASKATKPPEAPAPKPPPAPPPAAAAPVKPVAPPPPPQRQPPPPKPAPPAAAANNQNDIDAMLAELEAPARPKPPSTPASDVLDLTEAMAAPPPSPTPAPGPAPTFRTIDGASDVVFADRPPEPEPPPPPPARALEETRRAFVPPPPVSPSERSLLSTSASAAVDHAFNTLAQTMLVNNARTIEDLVKEMLRPMLKNWLDDNLPGLVERIVRTEIERVSRGRP
jgi:cell pole-organizing protein PopZ